MTISDLLTLIGIVLAIFAFISERSREYVLLKLRKWEIWAIGFLFLYVHFLLSYQWWRGKMDFLSIFEAWYFPTPEAWAYIISIGTLFYSVWKIFYGRFPLSRIKELLQYYNQLILKNDIAFLAQLVEKYHLSEIVKYLRKKKTIQITETGFWMKDQPEYRKAYKKVMNGRDEKYGGAIYSNIILNDVFIENVANINPYLFSQIIQELNQEKLKDDDFVNKFLKVLMINKNGNFFREIRNNQNFGQFEAYALSEERPILYALFNDVNVCAINQAWRGIAEPAIAEMREEAKKEYSVLWESDGERDNDTTWSFRITIAIWYFDIMVREAIIQNVDDHMWLFYYRNFVEVTLANMPELPFENSDYNRNSRNYDLISDMFSKMMSWKDVIIKSKNDNLIKCVYDCLGQCLYQVCLTDKLRSKDKNSLMNWIWEDLIDTWGSDEKGAEIAEKVIEIGFEMFKKPSMLFSPDLSYRGEESAKYLYVLRTLWEQRDTPKLHGALGERANDFQDRVIAVLLPDLARVEE